MFQNPISHDPYQSGFLPVGLAATTVLVRIGNSSPEMQSACRDWDQACAVWSVQETPLQSGGALLSSKPVLSLSKTTRKLKESKTLAPKLVPAGQANLEGLANISWDSVCLQLRETSGNAMRHSDASQVGTAPFNSTG